MSDKERIENTSYQLVLLTEFGEAYVYDHETKQVELFQQTDIYGVGHRGWGLIINNHTYEFVRTVYMPGSSMDCMVKYAFGDMFEWVLNDMPMLIAIPLAHQNNARLSNDESYDWFFRCIYIAGLYYKENCILT